MTVQVGYVPRPCSALRAIQRPEILGHRPCMGLWSCNRIIDGHSPGNSLMGILADRKHPRLAATPALQAEGLLGRDQRVPSASHDHL